MSGGGGFSSVEGRDEQETHSLSLLIDHHNNNNDNNNKLSQAVGLYKRLRRARDDRLRAWEQAGATKVCLRVDDEVGLLAVAEGARRLGLPSHIVADAGRTQVAAGSRTVLAVLGAGSEVDKLTGRLKLL